MKLIKQFGVTDLIKCFTKVKKYQVGLLTLSKGYGQAHPPVGLVGSRRTSFPAFQ